MPKVLALTNDLDAQVEAFEAAWAEQSEPDLTAFLPAESSQDYLTTLTELVRIDLELRHERGEKARLERYQKKFPLLFADLKRFQELAYEEFRLRAESGESPNAREYAMQYGIDTTNWPSRSLGESVFPPTEVIAVNQPADTKPSESFPSSNDRVLNFQIERELGRGSFGRVYLAQQIDLASRHVAIKMTTRFGRTEPETLARLQHSNIVPIYSCHQSGRFQIQVMPFLGETTFADVLHTFRERTSWPASGRELVDTLSGRQSVTETDQPISHANLPLPRPKISIESLAKFTYPDAILWMGVKLAQALAHAHDHGIHHRDIKPANILLTADGQPMLLDFNLSADESANGKKHTGGTPAYMAPEQLQMLQGKHTTIDERADIYGLGIVLFELLTGQHPFAVKKSSLNSIEALLESRQADFASLKSFQAHISPSTRAIISRCLALDPAHRYPSAQALAEDLQRQLDHKPLLHTKEPSYRERFQKWRFRHPRLSSSGSVAAIAACLLIGVSLLAVTWQQRASRLNREAVANREFVRLQNASSEALSRIIAAAQNPNERTSTAITVQKLVDEFDHDRSFEMLSPANRNHYFASLSHLFQFLAWEKSIQADEKKEPANSTHWQTALALTDRADQVHRLTKDNQSAQPTRFIAKTRSQILERMGKAAEAREAAKLGENAPETAMDDFLEGLTNLYCNRTLLALTALKNATTKDPQHHLAWAALSMVYASSNRIFEAEWAAQICIALRPDLPEGYYHRGLARHLKKDYPGADSDFTKVIGLDSNWEGAWICRAMTRAENGNPNAGLNDLDSALAINPQSYEAQQNYAHILSEKLNRTADAIAVLDRLLEQYPESIPSRVGRAVLLARMGNRDRAHRDAEICMKAVPNAEIQYQLAGVFAQTSKVHPADADRALQLIAAALKQGYGFEFAENSKLDPDLDPIRGSAQFQKMMSNAKAERDQNAKPKPAP